MSNGYEDDLEAEEALIGRDFEAEERGEVDNLELAKVDARTAGNRGRPTKVDPVKLVAWRQGRKATVAETARQWKVSEATVKRLSREFGEAAEAERLRYQNERLDDDLETGRRQLDRMYLSQRNRARYWATFGWQTRIDAAKGTDREEAIEREIASALQAVDEEFDVEWDARFGNLGQV